mgnify:CR=1 FL=1
MGLFHSPKIVTDGLSLCLDAGNKKSYPGSGSDWFDISGNNGNFTNDGATYNTNPSRFTLGDNEADHIESLTFSIINGFTAITTSMWISHSNQNAIAFISYATTSQDNEYLIYKLGGTSLKTFRGVSEVVHTVNFPFDTFYNLTHTNNGSTDKIYINGTEVSSLSFTFGTVGGSGRLLLGQEQDLVGGGFGTAQDFPGSYANLSIYNRALSAAEVKQNYNALKIRFGL